MTQDVVVAHTREGLRDRTLALRGLGVFEGVDDDGLTRAAEYARIRLFAEGARVTAAGEPLRSAYVVLAGQLLETRRDGRTRQVAPGHGIGLLNALAHETEAPLSVASVETRTMEIPVDAYLAALDENFTLLRNALRRCARGILEVRGNLPARPDRPPVVTMGTRNERPRTLVEKVIALSSGGGPIGNADVDALFDIARATREIHVPPGHVFWRVGDPATFALRIAYGRIRCTSGEGHVDVGSEFAIGVMDAVAGQPRGYEVQAVTDAVVYQTAFEDYLVALEPHPEVLLGMLSNLAQALIADA